jgi:hypothetical protein
MTLVPVTIHHTLLTSNAEQDSGQGMFYLSFVWPHLKLDVAHFVDEYLSLHQHVACAL